MTDDEASVSEAERLRGEPMVAMAATEASRSRTRAFARVIGPYMTVVMTITAIRLPTMGDLQVFDQPIIVWILGAMLLLMGLVIIAHHQIWSSAPGVVISLFGWFLALRGCVMLAVPDLMQAAVETSIESLRTAVRIGFGSGALLGLWLSWVGYRRDTPVPAG